MGALDLDRFELRVLDNQVLPLGDLVATPLVLGVDRLAGFLIDELLTQPIACPLVICRKAMRSALGSPAKKSRKRI